MDRQSVEYGVWLGLSVLALLWAYLQVVFARRRLNQVEQEPEPAQASSASSAVAELTGPVVSPVSHWYLYPARVLDRAVTRLRPRLADSYSGSHRSQGPRPRQSLD